MNRERTRFLNVLFAVAVSVITPVVVSADPCLVVYPIAPTSYHYDVNEYYTVTYGHPLYDPMYDRGGEVLIDIHSNQIALNIYQAPNLTGFEMSTGGNEGYFFIGSSFDLIIDGFNSQPTTYPNILLVFVPDPGMCAPMLAVDGNPVSGNTFAIGDLVVSTPTPTGNNYSDTMTKHITWSGCYGVRIWAFADENHNGKKDGGECFTAFSHDATVPIDHKSWGAVKGLYQ